MSGRFCYSCGRYEARCHCRAPWFDTSKAQAPSLTSDQRAALEAGAEALGLAASYASAGGNQAEYERLLVHARTLRAMADGVASDAEARDSGRVHALQSIERLLGVFCPADFKDRAKGERVAAAFSHAQCGLNGVRWTDGFAPPSTAEKGE